MFAVVGGVGILDEFFAEETASEEGVLESCERQDGYGVMRADGETCAAADAFFMVDDGAFADGDRPLVAAREAQLAAFAFPVADARLHVQVHGHLPAFCREAHGKLLDRAAESGEPVPLEMRQHDHAVRFGQRLRDARAPEMLQVDRDGNRFLAVRTVGDDRRDARESVFLRQRQVFFAGETLPAVQHAGLHEMRCAALCLNEVDDTVVRFRFQVGAVALFAEMHFQRHVGRQFGSGAFQQCTEKADRRLREAGRPRGGIERDEENVGHFRKMRQDGKMIENEDKTL